MNKKNNYDIVTPNASALIESLRAYGYSLNTAVADLVDNSISARSKNIWIWLEWEGEKSKIYLIDDGNGMTEAELINAMRAGSQNPLEERDKFDLGRFGLGLKTASFSQCRSLTVASKKRKKPVSVRQWDLDYVSKANEWRLLKTAPEGSSEILGRLRDMEQGTIVLLEKLDRVTGETKVTDAAARRHFLDRVAELEKHLAMVFHRFIDSPNPMRMFLNGTDAAHQIRPWSPFLPDHIATRKIETESKTTPQGTVMVSGFILPHNDKLGSTGHAAASGPAGWNEQQGFYVYRNKRLLVPGSWLGLGGRGGGWTKEEHYKLARISVDIPSAFDSSWQIDVKKSTAVPPHGMRQWLEDYAKDVRKQARQVFAHRGTYHRMPVNDEVIKLWKSSTRVGNRVYRIDRSHPLIKRLAKANKGTQADFSSLLKILEETVPVEKIWLDMAEHPEQSNEPLGGMSESEIVDLVKHVVNILSGPKRRPDKNSIDTICRMDGFNKYESLIRAHFASGEIIDD